MKTAWLTDIHLDFVTPDGREALGDAIRATGADALLIGGDIATSGDLLEHLQWFARLWDRPLYFVLGNHDFYNGSIAQVRGDVAAFCRQRPNVHYLSTCEPLELAPGVGLVGHDGWGDARAGDFLTSDVMLNDYLLIGELRGLDKVALRTQLNVLGDQAAEHLRRVLPAALAANPHVVVLTHVPPLRAACWHEGRTSDDNWAPHFTCQAMGEALLEILAANSDRRATVLCGHTHSGGACHPLPNLEIITGAAIYRQPGVQRVFAY